MLIAVLHHSFVLLHFHVFAFYFAFSSLFVHHGVFIHYCFALYIKTPKNPNSKVRPSSHKTPSSIPKKSLASSSRSPSVSATSAGPKESRSRVSTAADVEPVSCRFCGEWSKFEPLFYWQSAHCLVSLTVSFSLLLLTGKHS